jgi:DNA-binding response OmpR family regulator
MHARLVVADDDPVIRSLIGAALQGYTVLEASRGDDALVLARQERPDLILLDVQMPGLDGLAVAQALASDPATASIPVVLCSGAGRDAAVAAQRLNSVRAFIPKPFSLHELRATVEAALVQAAASGDVAAPAPRATAVLPDAEGVGVLIVLEQPVLAAVVTLALAHVHRECDVRVVSDVATAIDVLGVWRPHLVVFDMDLASGALLTRLGAAVAPPGRPGARVPVVALARRGDLPGMLEALDGDVDDLLSVPCSPAELVARLLMVLQRTSSPAARLRPVLRLGALELDLLSHEVHLGPATVSLSALEQQLLYLLAANAGRALTRDEILDYVWGVDFIAEPAVVDLHVRTLRAKLQPNRRASRVIAGVPGRGYTFVLPPETPAAARHPLAALPARRRRATARRPRRAPVPLTTTTAVARQAPELPEAGPTA